jgi:hypothetical protein
MEKNAYDPDTLLEVFVKVIRGDAPKYLFIEKNKNKSFKNVIRFDDDTIYFPSDLLWQIIKEHGLEEHANNILVQLKQLRLLKTDRDGMTKKIQVGNIRTEHYVFDKNLFNSPGVPDIVQLGKELTNV